MTDGVHSPSPDEEAKAARIARLAERRAAAACASPSPAVPTSTSTEQRARSRRAHPAGATRAVLAGGSISATLVMVAAMAGTAAHQPATVPMATEPSPTPPTVSCGNHC